jgi:glycosyltransferase involved in cell wall biosynthesis
MQTKEQPLLSIITVVLNGEKYIEQCINSVLEQDYNNIEYIIIDGGSTDKTIEIIKKYKISRWTSEKDLGISDAFNKGISLAKGDIIGFINSDDWLELGIIAKIVSQFSNAEIVYGKLRQFNKNLSYIVDADHHGLENKMSLNHPSVFVKTSVYKKYGGFDLDYKVAMDYEFLLRCYKNGVTFEYVPLVIANLRMDGRSANNWFTGIKEVKRAQNKYLNSRLRNELNFVLQFFKILISSVILSSPLANTFANRKKGK